MDQLREVAPEPVPTYYVQSENGPITNLPPNFDNTNLSDDDFLDTDEEGNLVITEGAHAYHDMINSNSENVDDMEDYDFDNYYPLHPVSSSTYHELCYLATHSLPVLGTFFSQYLIQILIPAYFASQLGSLYMSAWTLSVTTFYLTGPVLINGFTSSLDTLCSTAYGARHFHKVGHYYLQCLIILLVCMIPSMIFWSNSFSFFNYIINISFPNDYELANLCTSFLFTLTFVAPALVIFECTKRFLQSQCKFSVPTRVVVCGMPVSILLNWYLGKLTSVIDILDPIQVPAISFVITYWLMASSLVLYAVYIDGYQCLPPSHDVRCWRLIPFLKTSTIFFKLGLPGIFMIFSESFAFQIITFLSTTFSKDQLAAQSIVQTLASLAFQPPFAVGICCSTHVANLIGARSSNYKPAMKAIYILMILLSCFNFSWFFIFRVKMIKCFTDDEAIINVATKLAAIIAINQFLDCFNIICAAVLRGQGRQKIGSILSIISYYLVGVPLEIYLAFSKEMEIYGLWSGLAIAVGFLSIIELTVVRNSDWHNIIRHNHKLA
jgi:MATE family multidrug resistance protein